MSHEHRFRIVLADDHTLVSEGLGHLLEPHFDLLARVDNGLQAVEAARSLRPDAVLLDISMPVMNGIEAARTILAENPKIKLIFLTMHANLTYVREALRLGASGYLLKRSAAAEIVTAVRTAMTGKTYVTPLISDWEGQAGVYGTEPHESLRNSLTFRQHQVLQLVAEGRSARDIATHLNISIKTAEFHKQTLMRKLGVHTSNELTRYAIRLGLTSA